MNELAKLFDEQHLPSTISWVVVILGAIAALVVLNFVLSHLVFVLVGIVFLALIVGGILWFNRG
jgi:hypothetical protein